MLQPRSAEEARTFSTDRLTPSRYVAAALVEQSQILAGFAISHTLVTAPAVLSVLTSAHERSHPDAKQTQLAIERDPLQSDPRRPAYRLGVARRVFESRVARHGLKVGVT